MSDHIPNVRPRIGLSAPGNHRSIRVSTAAVPLGNGIMYTMVMLRRERIKHHKSKAKTRYRVLQVSGSRKQTPRLEIAQLAWELWMARWEVNMPSYRVQPNSCSDQPHCLSSYDDRPPHFIAPWEYEAMTKEDAILRLKETVVALGGEVVSAEGPYVYCTFAISGTTDDLEFLFASGDSTVALRSAPRRRYVPDVGRNSKRLDAIRQALGWQEVTILRSRDRALYFVESPFDSFGPTAPLPSGLTYEEESEARSQAQYDDNWTE